MDHRMEIAMMSVLRPLPGNQDHGGGEHGGEEDCWDTPLTAPLTTID